MSVSIILPLKGTKPAELSNALLSYYADVTKTRPPEAAAAAARTLDQVRERLSSIKALSDTTADAAATELLAYERQLAALARRLDNAGAALNVRFIWRDAFRPKQKVEKGDLDWERVCTLFNAAAALGYAASRAFCRGAQADAFKQLQRAAGCFAAAHDMVRPAIWGLDPRWDPASLSPDLGLEMLSALRDLMLAQAQHAFHQKALDEGIRGRWRCSEQRLFTGAAVIRRLTRGLRPRCAQSWPSRRRSCSAPPCAPSTRRSCATTSPRRAPSSSPQMTAGSAGCGRRRRGRAPSRRRRTPPPPPLTRATAHRWRNIARPAPRTQCCHYMARSPSLFLSAPHSLLLSLTLARRLSF